MAQPQSALRALDQAYLMGIGQGPAPARVPRTRGQTTADMLGAAAIGTTPIPIVGDITGLAADAAMYAAYPEERTMGNYAMSALGVLPLVPGVSALRALRDAPTISAGSRTSLDPSSLSFRELDQNRLEQVSELFDSGEEINPIVTIYNNGKRDILDGHNRAAVAISRKQNVPAVDLDIKEYELLKEAGFDDMEITYATLLRANEDDAASAINNQFYGAGIRQRGTEALSLMDEPAALVSTPSPLEGTLDMSQAARMQRAAEQGFNVDRPVYHSTDKDFSEFKLPDDPNFQKLGQGVYTSPEPSYGEIYVSDYKTGQFREGANVMPLLSRGRLASADDYVKAYRQVGLNVSHDPRQREIQRILRDQGFTGIDMNGEVLIFDPVNLRSTNAAFDPAKRSSPNIMASAAGATIGLSALRNIQRDEEPQPD